MKIFLAIGHKNLEEAIKDSVEPKHKIVGITVHKDGIEKGIEKYKPDILILREDFDKFSDLSGLIYKIKSNYSVRVIFLSKNRKPGDALLSTLISYSVYDILTGNISLSEILNLIDNPNEFKDIAYYQPKIKIGENNEKIFEVPEPQIIENKVEVVKYIDNTIDSEKKCDKQIKDIVISSLDEYNLEKVDDYRIEINENIKDVNKKDYKNKMYEEEKNKKEEKVINEMDSINKPQMTINTGHKLISFIGAKSGIGNTQIAFNTAINLAKQNLNVLFIELSNKTSSIGYIYQLNNYNKGLDTAMKGIQEKNYSLINDSIISLKDIQKKENKESVLYKNYKKMPSSLNLLLLSDEYESDLEFLKNELVNENNMKDLYIYLLLQKDFDVIVVDLPHDIHNDVIMTSIMFSTQVYFSLTQDICSISSAIYKINEMFKRRIKLESKLYYIINKYENAKLNYSAIKKWLGEDVKCEIITTIPNLNAEFIDCNYLGIPIIISTKNKEAINAFLNISGKILG